MKRTLTMLAVLSLLVAAGCATTHTSAPTSGGYVASVTGSNEKLQCVTGWNACVCAKDSRCCSVRDDCNCSGDGHSQCK